MGIEKITQKISSAVSSSGSAIKKNIAKVANPVVDFVKSGKNKLVTTMESMATNGKAMVLNSKEAHRINTAKNFHILSYAMESKMHGVDSKAATKGAKALVDAIGPLSYKDAQKSAEVLKNAPTPQSVLKAELKLKYNK